MNRRVLFWVLFIAMLALDQASKAWARHSFHEGQFYALWPRVFEITLTYNKGIAFGMFQGAGLLLAPVAIVIAGGSMLYSMRHPEETPVNHIIAALFAAGALGNLYDRVVHQKVTDLLMFRFIDFPVFNVADSCITIGAVLLFIVWARDAVKQKETPAEPRTSETLPINGE